MHLTALSASRATSGIMNRRNLAILIIVACTAASFAGPAIEIWLSERYGRYGDVEFDILGGRRSNPTPTGSFRVKAMKEDFYSRKYKAEMPYSIFFTDQCAIHAGSLRTLSHGCIHVDWTAARYLFYYVEPGDRVIIHP